MRIIGIIIKTIVIFFTTLFIIGLSADLFYANRIFLGWLTLIIPLSIVFMLFIFIVQVKKLMKICLIFFKKNYRILLSVGIFFGIAVYLLYIYTNKIKEEKINKSIINYCENVKWGTTNNEDDYNFFTKLLSNDEVACGDFIYLKPNVKKSSNGICHDENSTYYYRTKIYKTFNSMEDCLNSGGREPHN